LIAGVALAGRAAQAPPNLSGTWRPQNPATAGPTAIFEFTITQTADTISIRTPLQTPETVTLRLDGQESRSQGAGPGAPVTMAARAAWEGSKLAVTTTATMARGTNASKQLYSIDGDRLTIETSTMNPDGTTSAPRAVVYARYVAVPLPAPPVRRTEEGYVSLFNGKDLTDWKPGAPPDTFKVENGMIVANGVGGAGHLFYDGPVGNHLFQNFDLKLDAVARYRSNGGVYVMTQFQPQGFPTNGFEIQVNNSHTDRIRTGSLYHVVDLSNIPAKDDEWMPMEIVSRANTITITVKGVEVVRWIQPPDWQSNYDTPNRRIAAGTIAFQAHDPYSTTAYANIRIKLLN
jgi:hypothetical protein